MGLFSKISEGMKKTRESLQKRLDEVFISFRKVDEDLFEELEETLVLSDVGAITAGEICEQVKRKVKEKKITDPEDVKKELKETVEEILAGDYSVAFDEKPKIILVIGVNGVGKTTTIGKLACRYKKEGKKVILAAADTFRAAAIEQLEIWGERAGAGIVRHESGADPAAVAYDAVEAGKARNADVVICDTAGRMHNKKNLMDELSKIARVIHKSTPDAQIETLLVLDATTGQNAVSQARQFKEVADITGIVLTKLDGTAKGGIIIGIVQELGIPVKFIGVGESEDDLQPFDPTAFTNALFEE
ncbi:MAG: signal recognition particle-docking protein FtsY [Oscillospiraceae bacterium]|nr:signal recognition particle-docking protein FtsY [Oscillospiraceae bacterium]